MPTPPAPGRFTIRYPVQGTLPRRIGPDSTKEVVSRRSGVDLNPRVQDTPPPCSVHSTCVSYLFPGPRPVPPSRVAHP